MSPNNALQRTTLALAIGLLLSGCVVTSANHGNATGSSANADAAVVTAPLAADAAFTQLADAIWQAMQQQGRSGNQARLPDVSLAGMSERAEQQQQWLQQLAAIDASALSNDNQINLRMLSYRIQNSYDSFRFKEYLLPLNAEGGFHSSLAFMVRNTQFRTSSDYDLYLKRLALIPRYMEDQTSWLKEGMATGYMWPKASMAGFEDSIAAFIVQDPKDSVFYEPFNQPRPVFVSEEHWQTLQQRAAGMVDGTVVPAYQNYFEFMVAEYLPAGRDSIGASELPNGREYYQNRIKHFTTLDLSPEEIHAKGLAEVKRIRAEMAEVIARSGFDGSFAEFVDYLRTDPKFYPKTELELLQYAAYLAKKADGEMPKFFKLLPRQPYGIAPVPAEIAPKYTTGRYAGTSRDDRASFYWVNTWGLHLRPLYEMEALTLHEAVPGHHLQGALAREMTDLPDYRRSTYISAFGEGWGLYAEYLGLEMGFYQDPYNDFGRLSFEMWRAARLVVDTGMHALGWSREQAMEFMAENTALSLHNVRTEIDRYITWPGQALAYKLGEMLIRDLRQEAQQALGADFDLREFHHQLLKNGSIPLDILEREIRAWIGQSVAEAAAR
jgi:uncharacterized protein (DUF885 family)